VPCVPLASFIDWLDKHQGASTAFLTLALVGVTIYYAVQNRAMVREMKRAHDAAIAPKLALDFHRLAPVVITLEVENVGPGAAFDVDVRIFWDRATDGEAVEGMRWRQNVFTPGELADFFPPGDLNGNLNVIPVEFNQVRLVGTMKDAEANVHEVQETFGNLADWREVLHDVRQRFVEPDPYRRAAAETFKRFEQPMKDLRGSVDGVTRQLARLVPPEEEEEEEGEA
jgi:hypothetical protein